MKKPKTDSLPQKFEAFVEYMDWALPTESARRRRRFRETTYDEVKALYDFCHQKNADGKTRTEEALVHLDQFPLDNMPDAEQNLLNILLSFAEITSSVEAWGELNPPTITPYEIFTTHPDNDKQ